MPVLRKTFQTSQGNSSLSKRSVFTTTKPAKAKLVSVGEIDGEKIKLEFPFGPQMVEHKANGARIVEVARPGRKPILLKENEVLRTVEFTVLVADKTNGGASSVVGTLDTLETLATEAIPCKFVYGLTTLTYSVLVTTYSYMIKRRNQAGEPIQVELTVQLTEYVALDQDIKELKAVTRTVPTTDTTTYTKPSQSSPSSPSPSPRPPAPAPVSPPPIDGDEEANFVAPTIVRYRTGSGYIE